jgi:hypothetical protein
MTNTPLTVLDLVPASTGSIAAHALTGRVRSCQLLAEKWGRRS